MYKRHGLASQTPITFTGDVTIVSIAGTVLVLPAPAISNVLPANMSTILPTDTISFDVTFSTAGERRTLVAVRYADDLSTDLVHDGANFEALYNTSTRNAIVGGWHYVLRKNNGWPSPPQPVIFAFDKAGEEL